MNGIMNRDEYPNSRRAWMVVVLASGLLFIAILAASVRGHWRATSLEWIPADETGLARVSWGDGVVFFTHIRCRAMNDPNVKVGVSLTTDAVAAGDAANRGTYWRSMASYYRCAGFVYGTTFDSDTGYSEYSFEMPFWPLLVLTLVPPAAWTYRRWKERRRRLRGLCRRCGYDLRASEGRCPECGTPIARGIRASPDASRGAHPSAPG